MRPSPEHLAFPQKLTGVVSEKICGTVEGRDKPIPIRSLQHGDRLAHPLMVATDHLHIAGR